MNKQVKLVAAAVVVIIIALLTAFLVYKYSPSKEVMELTEYFKVKDDEMAVIIQNSLNDEAGHYSDGIPYLSYTMVKDSFNKRFYWDSTGNQMIYTTPNELIKIGVDSKEYSVNKSVEYKEFTIIKLYDGIPYIAAPFVKKYSNIEYTAYEIPNRIVITSEWGKDVLCSSVSKETSLRYKPDIKSPILAKLNSGDELVYVDTSNENKNGFCKVITVDGIIGYVKESKLKESAYKKLESSFSEPQYTHVHKDYDINMVWHQVTNKDANNNLLQLLNETKGVNTVSPTWFKITDSEGGVSSLADDRYVDRAHEAGAEVWGLCSDLGDIETKDLELLFKTTASREKLEKKLLSLAIEYNLDGINIDFERVTQNYGEDFIQFVREMAIKCRSNGLVLSIDNFVPVDFRLYYDYEEQGEVADYVVIMGYDEHYAGSQEAGSVSSINFVKNAASKITEMVNPESVIMALPFYTRLWGIEKAADGTEKVKPDVYGMNGADNLLKDRGLKASWDDETAQYYAEYNENGKTYKIWLEEETSIGEKLKATTECGISNFSFWRMGFERPEIWNVISEYFNKN